MLLIAQAFDPPPWAYILFFLNLLAFAIYARKRNIDDARSLFDHDLKARCLGLYTICIGLGVSYLVAYGPIHEAIAGNRAILVHRGAVGVPALIVFMGLIMLLGGRRSRKLLVRDGDRWTGIQYGFFAVAVGLCLAFELGFDRFMRARGYVIAH